MGRFLRHSVGTSLLLVSYDKLCQSMFHFHNLISLDDDTLIAWHIAGPALSKI